MRAWSEPWLTMGDPTMWSDVHGYPSLEKDQIELSKGWKWLQDAYWCIDKGIVGVETDADGWQYETNFASFSSSRLQRHTQRSGDNVRRRKWVRTKQHLESHSFLQSGSSLVGVSPVSVAWDVRLSDEKSRQITISSGCHISNQSSFDLEITFCNETDVGSQEDLNTMIVSEGITIAASVPLDMMKYNCFQIRPISTGSNNSDLRLQYQRSDKIKFKLSNRWSALKSIYMKTVSCLNEAGENIYHSLHFLEFERKLLVTVSSGLIIVNRLPCPVSVLCYNTKNPAIFCPIPSRTIESGAVSTRPHIDVSSLMGLKISIGDLISTEPLLIPPLSSSLVDAIKASSTEYQVFFKGNDISGFVSNNPIQLNLTVKTFFTDHGCLQLTIFSQFLLLDLSSTGVVVSSEYDSPTSLSSSGSRRRSSSKMDHSTTITINRYSCSSDLLVGVERKRVVEDALRSVSNASNALWLKRDMGVSLFQCGRDNNISLGVFGGKGWYANLSMDSLNSKKTAIEIIDTQSRNAVNIAVTLSPLTVINSCSQTHLLTVLPCYMVVNYMDEPIEFLHPSCIQTGIGGIESSF